MQIRDGLAVSLLADFEMSINQVNHLVESLADPASKELMSDIASTETLALCLLVFGSTEKAKQYLQKPNSRLGGMSPLHCIKTDADTRDKVVIDLIGLSEGYVF